MPQTFKTALVVGAGLSGAVAARKLAEAGHCVTVIEARNHVAGNCYDSIHPDTGERIHHFGMHLLHHGSDMLHEFLSLFTEWVPYEHKVVALLHDNKTLAPLPVNRTTLNTVFGVELSTEEEAATFLELIRDKSVTTVTNASELFRSTMGRVLSATFFEPYTEKQWGKPASEVSIGVGARLPVRTNTDDRYFTDEYQYLPAGGYTALVQNMLCHPMITVKLNTLATEAEFVDYDVVFTSQPIDQMLDYCLGRLPYRSVRFEHEVRRKSELPAYSDNAIVNFTARSGPTRQIFWGNLPEHGSRSELHVTTSEYPCDSADNISPTGEEERYYPIASEASQTLYESYVSLARELHPQVHVIGRLGSFKYLDMAPACLQAMSAVKKYLENN